MNRIFLGLAVIDGALLLVTFGIGLFVPSGGGGFAHDAHILIAWPTIALTLMVHGVVLAYFRGTGRWIREVVRAHRLPDWVHARAVRDKRRAFPFVVAGVLLISLTAALGAASDTIRGFVGLWHFIAASATISFTLGAFGFQYVTIVSQARLIREVQAQVERLRPARLAESGVPPPASNPADAASVARTSEDREGFAVGIELGRGAS